MRIAIIGCGNMGSGIARRLAASHQLFLYNRNPEKAELLAAEVGCSACQSMQEAITAAELIILAIKPQNLKDAAPSIAKELKAHQTLVSLLAGVTLAQLKEYFPRGILARMMPNVALLCGEGAIGLVAEKSSVGPLTGIFESLGSIYVLDEAKIDAFSSLAGSGPAFLFVMIESMVDAGIAMGLDIKEAKAIAYQMVKGSVALLQEVQKHPGELKWHVTSPGGTTIAGLRSLEEGALRGGIINTFLATYEKNKEFSAQEE